MSESGEVMTYLPEFCPRCLSRVVHGVGFAESDPWRALVVVVQLGLFQAATRDARVWGRCSPTPEDPEAREAADLTLVLAEIGCLGCFKPKTRDAMIAEVRSDGFDAVARRVKTTPTLDADAA